MRGHRGCEGAGHKSLTISSADSEHSSTTSSEALESLSNVLRGDFSDVPEGHESGAWLIAPKTGQEWKRLYRLVPLRDQDEALLYIIAHEAFHYLRRTRQIDGKNVEIKADLYAEGVLRAFQVLEEYPG